MNLWRISRHDDLEGIGGEKADARWHTAAKGKRIVYLAEHPAVALVEILANLKGNPALFPDSFRLMKIEVPPTVTVAELDPRSLPKSWRTNTQTTRGIGDTWLASADAALFRVPSAPSPESFNYLLNPRHSDAVLLSVNWQRHVDFDKRLFHLREELSH